MTDLPAYDKIFAKMPYAYPRCVMAGDPLASTLCQEISHSDPTAGERHPRRQRRANGWI